MDKEKLKRELYKALNEAEKRVEKARLKRALITIAFYSVLSFGIWYICESPKGMDILGILLISMISGVITFFLNTIVFNTLNTKSRAEDNMLDSIRSKITELEKETNPNYYEDLYADDDKKYLF